MTRHKYILLNFHAITNGKTNLLFGQLASSPIGDFSFREFGRKKTIRTLLDLYRLKMVRNEDVELKFDSGIVKARTDKYGRFQVTIDHEPDKNELHEISLGSGKTISVLEGLYPVGITHIASSTIVVSDIDDTVLHSFIGNKIKMFRTLLFKTVEKRKAVDDMMHLLKRLSKNDATIFYVSNSEQNLYPLIYRFLQYNQFPQGPLFLKNLRRLQDVVLNRKRPLGDSHKLSTLRKIFSHFPDKQFILIGDNTQNDLMIYLQMAEEFRTQVRHIVIRKVHERKSHELIAGKAADELKQFNIGVYYSDKFPATLNF